MIPHQVLRFPFFTLGFLYYLFPEEVLFPEKEKTKTKFPETQTFEGESMFIFILTLFWTLTVLPFASGYLKFSTGESEFFVLLYFFLTGVLSRLN